MVSLFRMNEQRKEYYFLRCHQLWETILANPQQSPLYQQAYRKLECLTQAIKEGLIRQREETLPDDAARREKSQQAALEQSAFQALMLQVSENKPVPAFTDFEPDPTASQDTAPQALAGPLVSDRDAKRALDDVEIALALLNIDVKKTSLEDLHAGLTILDLPEGTHSKVDDYLRSVFCKPKEQ